MICRTVGGFVDKTTLNNESLEWKHPKRGPTCQPHAPRAYGYGLGACMRLDIDEIHCRGWGQPTMRGKLAR